jgi:recombination protein RecT
MTNNRNPLAVIKQSLTSDSFAQKVEAARPVAAYTLTAQRVAYAVMSAMAANGRLMACKPESIRKCAIDAVSLGLVPGGQLGHAYLVPFGQEATLIIGYRGMIELAKRSGVIARIEARVVYDGDFFEVDYGSEAVIIHKPTFGERGEMLGVYAIAHDVHGNQQFEIMTKEEIEHVRNKSRAKDNGPWKTDYHEMARKTAVKRLCKYLPMTADMAQAIEIDARTDTGDTRPILDAEIERAASVVPASGTQALTAKLTGRQEEAQTDHTSDEYDYAADEYEYEVLLDQAKARHGAKTVAVCMEALRLPESMAEYTDVDLSIAMEGMSMLADRDQPPAEDELEEWADLVRMRATEA